MPSKPGARSSGAARPVTPVGVREVPESLADKLLGAAAEIGSSFDDVRMDDIASASGIPRATLYYYFAGKDDVLAFLLRAALIDLAESASQAVDREGDAATRLLAVIEAQLQHLADNPATSQLLIANLGKAGQLPDIAARIEAGFHTPVRKLLEEGVADGTIRAVEDPELGASAFFGAVLVVGLRLLVVDGTMDVTRVTASLAQMFWHGIAPDSSRPIPRR